MSTQARGASPRRRVFVTLIAVVLLAGGVLAVKYGRYHLLPKRFAEVEPGRLYRSGYCEPGPLTDVIREHRIKTILTLLSNEPDSSAQQKEETVARREGVELLRIPMPGDGRGEFAALDAAADAMADRSKQPMLVHCSAGVNRTGAAYVAYRLKYDSWSFDRAMQEAEHYGWSPRSNPELRDHLRSYADYLSGRAGRALPASQVAE